MSENTVSSSKKCDLLTHLESWERENLSAVIYIQQQIQSNNTYLLHSQHALLLDHSVDRGNVTVGFVQQELQAAVLGVLHQVAICLHVVLLQGLLKTQYTENIR